MEAHLEPLYVALWSKQASGRAHACSWTLRAWGRRPPASLQAGERGKGQPARHSTRASLGL
eukprot:scaffold121828_cov45-Phaeocystis_antarctica.AAC.1